MKAVRRSSEMATTAPSLMRTPWFLTIVLASALCLAYLAGVFVEWGRTADRSLYANLGLIPIGLAATFLAGRASQVQTSRRLQWAWRLYGAGLACFLAGDVLFFVYQNVLGSMPFPSLADAGYITYYPLMLVGLLLFPKMRVSPLRRIAPFAAGCAIVLGGFAAIVFLLLLPTLQSGQGELFAYCLSVGYPVGDLLLLLGIAWMLLRTGSRGRPSIELFTAGVAVGLFADVVYGYQNIQGTFQSGGVPDAAYMVSWALFAWSTYVEVERARRENDAT
jgi:hypothetical protein